MVIIFRYRFIHILIETDPVVSIKIVERCENVHQYELKYSILYKKPNKGTVDTGDNDTHSDRLGFNALSRQSSEIGIPISS